MFPRTTAVPSDHPQHLLAIGTSSEECTNGPHRVAFHLSDGSPETKILCGLRAYRILVTSAPVGSPEPSPPSWVTHGNPTAATKHQFFVTITHPRCVGERVHTSGTEAVGQRFVCSDLQITVWIGSGDTPL